MGQSLQIVSFDTIVQGNAFTSDDIYGKAAIKNNSATAKVVKVKRHYDASNPLIDSNAICWGFCFETTVDISPMGISIAPGSTNSIDFSGHVYPDKDGIARAGQIMYTFFVDENPQDSASILITFEVSPTFSIAKYQNLNRTLSIYPNPGKNWVELSMEINANESAIISFADITGRIVKSTVLQSGESLHRLNISDLKAGIYLYTVSINHAVVATRRLVVKK